MTEIEYIGLEDNKTTLEAYKQIWLLLAINKTIFIKIDDPTELIKNENLKNSEGPRSQISQGIQVVQTVGTKISPLDGDGFDIDSSQAVLLGKNPEINEDSQIDSEDELNEDQLLELERLAIEKEKEIALAEKRERAFQRKKKCILCCQSISCFRDEEGRYDLNQRLPSCMQVCCWRFLRSRRLSTKFYTGNDAILNMENSAYSVFVSLLISFNYLILYAVVIVPFVLIAKQEDIETILVDGEEVPCQAIPLKCEDKTEQERIEFNNIVLLLNAGVLIYSMMCESIIICINLKPSNTKCGSYLVCQILTGLTMRSVILISAQLIAVFIQDVNLINYTLGCTIASTLVLSQIRAV